MAEQKIVTINLRKKLVKVPRWKRAKQATKILREILEKQTKGKVKFSKTINEKIWSKGIENPPSKVRIKIVKIDEKNFKAELVK